MVPRCTWTGGVKLGSCGPRLCRPQQLKTCARVHAKAGQAAVHPPAHRAAGAIRPPSDPLFMHKNTASPEAPSQALTGLVPWQPSLWRPTSAKEIGKQQEPFGEVEWTMSHWRVLNGVPTLARNQIRGGGTLPGAAHLTRGPGVQTLGLPRGERAAHGLLLRRLPARTHAWTSLLCRRVPSASALCLCSVPGDSQEG